MSVDWTDEVAAVAALRGSGIESDLADGDLHAKALAAVQDIAARGLGPGDPRAYTVYARGESLIELRPPATSVADVTEAGIILATDGSDYRIRPGGMFLERLSTSLPYYWYGTVTFAATPAAADERYDRVVCDLVRLSLEFSALDSRRDADYSEESIGVRSGGTRNYHTERDSLIAELDAGLRFA